MEFSAFSSWSMSARDLDFLRDEERAPLKYDAARHGFCLADETYALPAVTISRREAFSFGLARKLLTHHEATPLHLDMRSVLDKIAESLEGEVTIEPDWLSEHVGVLPEDRVKIDPDLWAQLAGFIERRAAIRAGYRTFTGRRSEYGLHPYHLLAYHGNWYLFARNLGKDRVQTFALSRFERIETAGQTFSRPVDFDAERYARHAFGITGGEIALKVRLLFEPKLAVYITERQWHATQEFHQHADGRVEMRLETTRRKELIRWVLSWMPDVRVLAHKSLRDRSKEKLQDGLRAQISGEEIRRGPGEFRSEVRWFRGGIRIGQGRCSAGVGGGINKRQPVEVGEAFAGEREVARIFREPERSGRAAISPAGSPLPRRVGIKSHVPSRAVNRASRDPGSGVCDLPPENRSSLYVRI